MSSAKTHVVSRRQFLQSAGLAVAAAVLAACQTTGSQTAEPPTEVIKEVTRIVETEKVVTATPPPPAEPVTLKVWNITESPEYIQLMEKLSAKFEGAQPGVTVEFTPYRFADMQQTWPLAIDSDTGPDVAYIGSGGPFMVASAKAGKLLDMLPYAKEAGWQENMDWALVEIYNDLGGPVCGVPYEYADVGAYYNKDLFQQLGLQVPKTWEEFEKLLATLKANGHTPFAVGGLDSWPLGHYFTLLVHLTTAYEPIHDIWTLQPDGDNTAEGFVQAMTIVKDWADKGYFNQDPLAVSMADALDLFVTGKTAMMIAGTWNTADIVANADFEAGYFPVPMVDASLPWRSMLGPNNFWVIPKSSKVAEVALAYVDYMLSQEAAEGMWELGMIPMYKFAQAPQATSGLQLDIYQAAQVVAPGHYIWQNNHEVQAEVDNAVARVVAGEQTPAEALASVQELYEKAVAEKQ